MKNEIVQEILYKTHPNNSKLVIPIIGDAAWKFHVLKEMLDKHYKSAEKFGSSPVYGVYEFEGREIHLEYHPRPHLVKRFLNGEIPNELMVPDMNSPE